MAAKKYLKVDDTTGLPTEVAATVTSSGAGNDGDIVALDSSGKLSSTVLPAGVGADSTTATAGEALSAGDLVYINSSGNIMKADADTADKAAIGFVTAAVSNAATGTVYFEGSISGLSGMTPGKRQFLSATAGTRTETPPTTAGHIVQCVGVAVSATVLTFEAGTPIVRA